MEVLEHEDSYKIIKCPRCGTLFEYSQKDVYFQNYLDRYAFYTHEIYRESLECPECEKRFDLILKIDGEVQ